MGWRKAIYWVLVILAFLVFVLVGFMQIIDYNSLASAEFERWGYPDWFRYVVSIVEILSAVFLLFHASVIYAAMVLGFLMVGAIATHLSNDPAIYAALPAAIGILLIIIVILRLHEK